MNILIVIQNCMCLLTFRSSRPECSVKKVLLEISQNSQENTCARVYFLMKLQEGLATLLKKRLWHRCFCECCETSKNSFLQRTPLVAASGGWQVWILTFKAQNPQNGQSNVSEHFVEFGLKRLTYKSAFISTVTMRNI